MSPFCWYNRRPPEHPCPVAIDDSIRAYRWMLQLGISPVDIYLAGDSAGGALAVSTCIALVNFQDPAPAGLVLMSPWVDVSDGRGESSSNTGIVDGGTCNVQRPSFGDNATTDYITVRSLLHHSATLLLLLTCVGCYVVRSY